MSIKDEIKNIELEGKTRLVERLNDAFDMNYDVSQIKIESMEEFHKYLSRPFLQGAQVYYRGERISSHKRKLLPTLLRSNEVMELYDDRLSINIDTKFIKDYYNSKHNFISVYETIYNDYEQKNLYSMLAFAQHYLDVSPFIDFSKSLYVALTFAMKGRDTLDDDIVIYTAYDIDFDDTSSDIEEVNSWLENYRVQLVNTDNLENGLVNDLHNYSKHGFARKINEKKERKIRFGILANIVDKVSPVAKLIDIPTNDLMKYQQGVFLLLNDFSLVDSYYLTKNVRQSFVISKYIISAKLAEELKGFLLINAPQYKYESLMNISLAVRD